MAVREAPPVEPEVAPDVRGPTAPLPATILALGIASLVVIALGLVVSQVNYALSDRVLTQNCIDEQISPEDNGAIGVCNIVEALEDPVTTGSALPRDRPRGARAGARGLDVPPHGQQAPPRSGDHRRRARLAGRAPGRSRSCGSGRRARGCSRSTSSTSRISRGTGRVRPGRQEHVDPGVRRRDRRHRDRPGPRDPRALAAAGGPGSGADLHQLLPRDAADLAAGHRVLPAALRIRHPSVGVRRWRSSCSR